MYHFEGLGPSCKQVWDEVRRSVVNPSYRQYSLSKPRVMVMAMTQSFMVEVPEPAAEVFSKPSKWLQKRVPD